MIINYCPKCNSRLWNVVEYSAPKGLFRLSCDDCKYTETKDGFILTRIKNELF